MEQVRYFYRNEDQWLVVEDTVKMNTWKKIWGNGPDMFPEKVYNSVLNDSRTYSSGPTYVQMTKEKISAALGNSNVCGIGLYKANSANGTSFKNQLK